jgi:hypothetical protein
MTRIGRKGGNTAQRTKDNEQIGREADALIGIEKERAKRRQAEQAKKNQPRAKKANSGERQKQELVPTSEKKAQARDTVGEKVGAILAETAQRSNVQHWLGELFKRKQVKREKGRYGVA